MLTRLRTELPKWTQTIQIWLSQRMAYKLHFVLLVIGPTLVFFFVKYNLWSSIYELQEVKTIQGYDLESMLQYQVWVMIVAFIAQGYNAMNLAEDIRLGRISAYLIYPFEFWEFHTAGFLALQIIQFFVAAVTLLLTVAAGVIALRSWPGLLAGAGFSFLVGFFWFSVSYSLGLAAFWLEETWVLRVMFMTVSSFLSGAILPLEVFPDWLRTVLEYTPFPYITFVPVKIFMGEYDGSLLSATLNLGVWIALSMLLAQAIWKRGLRLYSAAGM